MPGPSPDGKNRVTLEASPSVCRLGESV